jgi:Fur family ferric uptake transcriptional regulator
MPHCDTFIQTLRQRGYRVTPQREMIVEIVAHSGRHMSAEEVFKEVQARTRAINVATVYRTLELLVEEGLVSRADLRDGRVIYATARHGPHVHLVCRHCGGITDADVDPLGRDGSTPVCPSSPCPGEGNHGVSHPRHFFLAQFGAQGQ